LKNTRHNSPDSFLVDIKEAISASMGLDGHTLAKCVDRFVSKLLPDLDSVKKRYICTNILGELSKDKMTIKVFFKFLRIINIKKIKFNIEVTTAKDNIHVVQKEVNFTNMEPYDHDL
jgi:hypothetical protein